MSQADFSQNPYSPPTPSQYRSSGSGPQDGSPPLPPKGITVVGVLYTVFGALGLLGVLGAIFGLVWVVAVAVVDFGMPADQVELQRKMLPWTIGGGVFALINGVLSLFLLMAGIRLLKKKTAGADLAVKLFTPLVGLEITKLLFTIVQQVFTMGMIRESMMDQMSNPGQGPGEDMAEMIFIGSMIVGILFTFGYSAAKMTMYFLATRYLKKPEIRAALSS